MIQQTNDRKWFDQLVMELRLRQVHGSAIGDTVASAKELLSDTGQRAEEAFGPARDYADALELPSAPKHDWIRESLWRSMLGLLAFLLFNQAALSWSQSQVLLVSPAQLAFLVIPVVLVAFLPLFLDAIIRRVWIFIGISGVCALSGVLSVFAAPTDRAEAWLTLDPLPWLVGSALVMVAISIRDTIRSSSTTDDDAIIDPRSETAASTGVGPKVFVQVTNWLFPILALGMLCLALSLY